VNSFPETLPPPGGERGVSNPVSILSGSIRGDSASEPKNEKKYGAKLQKSTSQKFEPNTPQPAATTLKLIFLFRESLQRSRLPRIVPLVDAMTRAGTSDMVPKLWRLLRAGAIPVVEWQGSRLICVAGDVQNSDEYAVKQMNRTIDLVRYQRYGDDLLLLEQLTTTTPKPAIIAVAATAGITQNDTGKKCKTVSHLIGEAPPALLDLYHTIVDHLQAAGDDVQVKPTEFYMGFRRINSLECV